MFRWVTIAALALVASFGVPAASADPPITMTIHPVAHFGADHTLIEVDTTISCDPAPIFLEAEVTVFQKRGAHIVRQTAGTNFALCDGQPHAVRFELRGVGCTTAVCYWRKGKAVSWGIVQWEGADRVLYQQAVKHAAMTIV